MTKRERIDTLIGTFETALENAGFQNIKGTASKPYYFRNHIAKGYEKGEVVFRYTVTDVISKMASDEAFLLDIYINGVIFVNSKKGFGNANYKTRAKKIEEEMNKLGWSVVYTFENEFDLIGSNNSITYASNIEFRKIGG